MRTFIWSGIAAYLIAVLWLVFSTPRSGGKR